MEQILQKKQFSEATKKVYVGIIKRLKNLKFKFPSKKLERVDYIKKLFADNSIDKASSRLDLLNVIIILRMIEGLPVNKLKLYRAELFSERLTNNVSKMSAVKDTLMSKTDFEMELLKALGTGQYKKFIVNYLMLAYGTRNMDVDVKIIKAKKDMTDDKQNYLRLMPKKVIWYRNNYKTFKTYKPQVHEITDSEFIRVVKKQGVGHLFETDKFAYQLKKELINGMNEARIFKMLVDDAYEKKDTIEINRLSKNRGTSIQTIKSFYDVNGEIQIIKEL